MGIISAIFIGLIVGAIAKFLMPGRDPGGWIVTILIGLAGSFIGTPRLGRRTRLLYRFLARKAAQGQIFDQLRGLLGEASGKAMQDMEPSRLLSTDSERPTSTTFENFPSTSRRT